MRLFNVSLSLNLQICCSYQFRPCVCALIVLKLRMPNPRSYVVCRIGANVLNSIMGCKIKSNGFNYRRKHRSPPPVINYTSYRCVPVESLGYEASWSNHILWLLQATNYIFETACLMFFVWISQLSNDYNITVMFTDTFVYILQSDQWNVFFFFPRIK